MGRFQTMLAARERRRSRRYDIKVKALITPEGESTEQHCTIQDISQTGALIEVDDAANLQDFTLTVSRRCRVVRRDVEGAQVGVEFLVPWTVNS
jgi:c-di-GMP-binding flagellar brake protein YcgR